MKSELFSSLEDIVFAEKDPEIITSEIISQYELLSGRTLAQGDPVRVFLDSIILALIQQRNIIDNAEKMNLLAYASGNYLDHLGALLGVSRLGPSSASCTVSFKLSEAQNFTIIIPQGTRITPDGNIFFAVNNSCEIRAGNLEVSCECTCSEPGIIGNNFVIGQVNKLVDIFPYEMSAQNITTTTGGTDTENDENFRERIMLAPESFSNAGSSNGYKFFAKSAHPDIIDAAIISPPDIPPGHVKIIPLMAGGVIPSDEIISAVYNACNAEDIRPDTDYLTVEKPEEIFYDLDVSYWIDEKNSSSSYALMKNIEQAIQDFILWQRLALGRDINPSELTKRIILAGAKRCIINQPVFKTLMKNQLAICNSFNVSYSGIEEG